jgi:hypothetical protein
VTKETSNIERAARYRILAEADKAQAVRLIEEAAYYIAQAEKLEQEPDA